MKGDQSMESIMKMPKEAFTGKLKSALDSGFEYIDGVSFPLVSDMRQATVLMPESLKRWARRGNRVVLQASGAFYRKRYFYRFFDFRPAYDRLDRTRNLCVQLTVCAEGTLRIQAAQGFSVSGRESEMLVDGFDRGCDFTVSEDDASLTIETPAMRAVITKDPWNLSVFGADGKCVYRQMGMEDRSFMRFEHAPFGFLFDTEKGDAYACESVRFSDGEHFYGLGERFAPIDKKGQNVNLWQTNALGVYTDRAYKNIPFFMSTAGYGLFLHTAHKANCNMGAHHYKAYGIMTGDSEIDLFLFVAPSMKQILRMYCDVTGSPAVPPRWSFGFWISKISYESRPEVEALAERLRREDIPCDVIHIDTNWYKENWVCDYKFCDEKFPDAEGMIRGLLDKGFRVTLWQMPYIDKGELSGEVYDEGFRKGYFAFRADGGEDFRHGLVDFSNPEAVDWYCNKLLRPLLEMGVAGIKVDFGESAPAFYQYARRSGDEIHNLYPLLYNKACFDITKEVTGDSIIWARSAWAGSQRYPLHWGGDCGTDFMALATSIKAGLSFGLSGFPFWSHDIGGFFYESNPRLYARWMQVGCFTSHARTHGFFTREPWDFGEEALGISRKYLKLRYRLMPYITSQAERCARLALPMMRALVLEYQRDPNVYAIDTEYMFGDSLLVAPVLDETDARLVYLPDDQFFDYWTGELHPGGRWIEVSAPLDVLPLFVKAGAILPMGPDMRHVDERPTDQLTLCVYPLRDGDSEFDYVHTDGTNHRIAMRVGGGKAVVHAGIPGVCIRLENCGDQNLECVLD